MLTEDTGNIVWDPGRVLLMAGGIVTLLAMAALVAFGIIALYLDRSFDFLNWATGYAAILSGFGVFLMGAGVLLFSKAKGEGPPT